MDGSGLFFGWDGMGWFFVWLHGFEMFCFPVRKKTKLNAINDDDKLKMRLRFELYNANNFRDNKNI